MRDHISLTAMAVATARALAGVDSYAHMFLPEWLSERVKDASPENRRKAIEWLSLGFVTHLKHRTIAIDEATREVVVRGASQVVILGAGLDTRAYRMPELSSTTVYEVDHPATQRAKLKNVHFMRSSARALKHVEVDFERDSLEEKLERAGHRRDEPTAWIWEGVTMYLEPAAVESTLAALERLSAPSSRLTMTYAVSGLFKIPFAGKILARATLASLGEPLRAIYAPADVRGLLARHQFDVSWDGYPDEWPSNEESVFPVRLIEERVVVADHVTTTP